MSKKMKHTASLNLFSQRFRKDEEGSIFILFALGLVFLVAIAGVGVDLGRQQLQSASLQLSADSASLAGAGIAASLNNPDNSALTDEQIEGVARRYFRLNYESNTNEAVDPKVSLVGTGSNIELQVDTDTQTIATSFVKQFGTTSLESRGASTTRSNRRSEAQPYEILLVMDNSGSMSGLLSVTMVRPTTPIVITPVPRDTTTGPRNGSVMTPISDGGGGSISIVTRMSALKSAAKILVDDTLTEENDRLPSREKTRVGAIRWADNIVGTPLPLVNADGSEPRDANAAVTDYIKAMEPRGNTDSSVALAAAYTMLKETPLRPNVVRAVVLLTDGRNEPNQELATAESLKLCKQLKEMRPTPTLIYTIAFGDDVVNDTTVGNFLRDCATPYNTNTNTNYFFSTASEAELKAIFANIAATLKKVRIVK